MGGTAPGFVGGQIQFLDSSTAGAQYSYAYVNAEAGSEWLVDVDQFGFR